MAAMVLQKWCAQNLLACQSSLTAWCMTDLPASSVIDMQLLSCCRMACAIQLKIQSLAHQYPLGSQGQGLLP